MPYLEFKRKAKLYLQVFQNLEGLDSAKLSVFISRQFSNFFNAYAKAFNKQHNRKGSLFMKPFKRKRIEDEKYLRRVVHYIHYNPVKARLVNELADWKYSSFPSLISNRKTKLCREEVITLFECRSNFMYCHQTSPLLSEIEF